jgi:hypothetical protein
VREEKGIVFINKNNLRYVSEALAGDDVEK